MDKLKSLAGKVDKKIAEIALIVLAAFLATVQISYLISLTAAYGGAFGIVITLVFAGITGFLFWAAGYIRKTMETGFKKRMWFSYVTGAFFALTVIVGYQLQYQGYSSPGMTGKFFLLMRSLCLDLAIGPVFYFVFHKLENVQLVNIAKKGELNLKKTFFLSWLVIFVAYIPAFLAYYPMILSYDFHSQVLMAESGFEAYWMHHPYLSTLMIAGFYKLGKLMNNVALGMAFMGITHMLISGCCYAYMVTVLYRLHPKRWVPYVATLVLALFPTNPVMVLCTTKDVIFSDFFILFASLGVVRFLLRSEDSLKTRIGLDVCIVLSGAMGCLWRNNMVYGVLAAGILLAIFVKKKQKLVMLILTVMIFLGNKGGIAFLRDVVIHDQHVNNAIEMMSVVVQAYGRTVTYNRDSLSNEDIGIIARYIPQEYWEKYNPAISDVLKGSLVYTYFDNMEGHWGDVIKDWITVGMRYPDQYIDSFLDTTRGYWFIDDTSYADVLGDGLEGNMGIIYTYYSSESWAVEEIKHTPIWPGAYMFYEKLISRNDVLRWPVLNLLFKPAFYTLLTFFAAILFIYKKEWNKLGFMAFPVMYILTMFLGPVVQFRYVYPWIITSMLWLALTFSDKQREAE